VEVTPGLIALIGTIFGGAGLKIIESWLSKSARKTDDAKEIRDELRLTITELRTEISELEKSVDRWRTDYYAMRDEKIKLETRLQIIEAKNA
jgi:HAMP domain-containing protein